MVAACQSELNNWGLKAADVDDAYIEEAEIQDAELSGVVTFGSTEEGGDILVVGKISMLVNASYSHPNWAEAMWDSEDKRLIPFEDISGEAEIELEAGFSMKIRVDEKGAPVEIDGFAFRDENFLWVDLHPSEHY